MQFSQIYLAYLTIYLGDTQVSSGGAFTLDTTDPEWQIAIQHYNTALRRWANVDGELWDVLWTNLATAATGTKLYTAGTTTYAAPSDMKSIGSKVTLGTATSGTFDLPIISPEDVQHYTSAMTYAYLTGDEHAGFTVNINAGNNASYNGYAINYSYYKKPTYLTLTETGTSICQIPDTDYPINIMLSLRYQESRNYPAYQIADKQATQALANMEVRNKMGVPGNAWTNTAYGSGWGY